MLCGVDRAKFNDVYSDYFTLLQWIKHYTGVHIVQEQKEGIREFTLERLFFDMYHEDTGNQYYAGSYGSSRDQHERFACDLYVFLTIMKTNLNVEGLVSNDLSYVNFVADRFYITMRQSQSVTYAKTPVDLKGMKLHLYRFGWSINLDGQTGEAVAVMGHDVRFVNPSKETLFTEAYDNFEPLVALYKYYNANYPNGVSIVDNGKQVDLTFNKAKKFKEELRNHVNIVELYDASIFNSRSDVLAVRDSIVTPSNKYESSHRVDYGHGEAAFHVEYNQDESPMPKYANYLEFMLEIEKKNSTDSVFLMGLVVEGKTKLYSYGEVLQMIHSLKALKPLEVIVDSKSITLSRVTYLETWSTGKARQAEVKSVLDMHTTLKRHGTNDEVIMNEMYAIVNAVRHLPSKISQRMKTTDQSTLCKIRAEIGLGMDITLSDLSDSKKIEAFIIANLRVIECCAIARGYIDTRIHKPDFIAYHYDRVTNTYYERYLHLAALIRIGEEYLFSDGDDIRNIWYGLPSIMSLRV